MQCPKECIFFSRETVPYLSFGLVRLWNITWQRNTVTRRAVRAGYEVGGRRNENLFQKEFKLFGVDIMNYQDERVKRVVGTK